MSQHRVARGQQQGCKVHAFKPVDALEAEGLEFGRILGLHGIMLGQICEVLAEVATAGACVGSQHVRLAQGQRLQRKLSPIPGRHLAGSFPAACSGSVSM